MLYPDLDPPQTVESIPETGAKHPKCYVVEIIGHDAGEIILGPLKGACAS